MVRRWNLLAVCLAAGLLATAGAARGADNLVFVPLQPCRVIDTRGAGGGPLVAGTPRTFIFRGPTTNYQNPTPLPDQGGSTTGCGIPDLTSDVTPFQNIVKAVAINIVAVGPAGAGDLRAWPANQTAPNASVINYAAVTGLNIANGVIVPMCDEVSATPCAGGDITFRADVHGTYLVVDVVGYFHAGSPTFTVHNTALGHGALAANSAGTGNTADGFQALAANTTGTGNSAVGAYALVSNTTGFGNTAAGYAALAANLSGKFNTATGNSALQTNGTGSYNTADGHGALRDNTTGYGNTASGSFALYSNITGLRNTAVGASSLGSNTVGSANTAQGYHALNGNVSGIANTAVGPLALAANSTGSHNTAVGGDALRYSTGNYNIAIGAGAGFGLTLGNDNILIGNSGGAESYTIRIGSGQSRAFIYGIRGYTTGRADAIPVLIDSAGQLGTVSSSIRFKEDVHDLGAAADRVLDLRPVSFRYKKAFANGEKPVQYGLIAEEVEKVLPELVAYGKDGRPESVKYQVLPTLLLAELEKEHAALAALRQEKAREIAALTARVEALERRSREGAAPTRAAPAPR